MREVWRLKVGGRERGPFTAYALAELLRDERWRVGAAVRRDDWPDWKPAEEALTLVQQEVESRAPDAGEVLAEVVPVEAPTVPKVPPARPAVITVMLCWAVGLPLFLVTLCAGLGVGYIASPRPGWGAWAIAGTLACLVGGPFLAFGLFVAVETARQQER
jgi:hypothetical protein